MGSTANLTPDMKATIALNVSLLIYLIGTFLSAISGAPVYALLSLVFVIPYSLFAYFGWKGNAWSYLGSSLLSAVLLVVSGSFVQNGTSAVYLWYAMLAALLFALISLEGFKSYIQGKGR